MVKLNVYFDNKEYFKFSNLSANHTTENNISLKEVSLNAVVSVPFKDFIVDLNTKNKMLASVYIDDKIYIEGYINQDNLKYRDSADGGVQIDIIIKDRFIAIKKSDIIKTKPKNNGFLQNFICNILDELDFTDPQFINKYQKKVNKSSDLLINGLGVSQQFLKSFARNDIVQKDALSLIGEACTLSNLLLISNGYDTLTLEKPNSYEELIFLGVRNDKMFNISYGEKTGDDFENCTPSKIIILNSSEDSIDKDGNYKGFQDKNTSLLVNYSGGLPHIQKIRNLSVDATYQEISKSINFNLAGIKAKSNSFLYKIPHKIFDVNGNFFIPNRSVKILDEKYGIDEVMTILQVGFTIDSSSGSELTLNVTTKEAFDNNASIKQKRILMKK